MKIVTLLCVNEQRETKHLVNIQKNDLVDAICRECKYRTTMAMSDMDLQELKRKTT